MPPPPHTQRQFYRKPSLPPPTRESHQFLPPPKSLPFPSGPCNPPRNLESQLMPPPPPKVIPCEPPVTMRHVADLMSSTISSTGTSRPGKQKEEIGKIWSREQISANWMAINPIFTIQSMFLSEGIQLFLSPRLKADQVSVSMTGLLGFIQ